jgi:hypothetical protein
MKIQYPRKSLTDQNHKTASFSVGRKQLEHLRHFSKWLLVIPAAILLLFGGGQLCIMASQKLAERNLPLSVRVDYGPWAYVLIHSSLSELPHTPLHGEILGVAPSGEQGNDPSIVIGTPQPTAVVQENPTATDTLPSLSSTPSPSLTPVGRSAFTATPTVKSSPLATSSPTQPVATTSIPEPNKFCDADENPLSYDALHYHIPDVKNDGFGTIVHALRIDEEETKVILEKVTVKQNQANPSIVEVVSVEWSHWGMGSTKIDVHEAQAEVAINPNLEFYACFAEGRCDHSLYGGEIYIDFDGELSGEYQLIMDIYFPEYDEKCKLDLHINAEP